MSAGVQLDQAKVTAFEERFVDTLNAGALCLMISVGHRTGLFDAMAELPRRATSAEIAEHAGLHERYVREWLGAMVTAGLVYYDEQTKAYQLPPEHAARLTRNAAPANLAVFAQYVPLLGAIEDDITECFRKGGGVPYARYGRFHEIMAEESAQTVLPALREHILPLVPGLLERLQSGIRVCDIGCGRGKAVTLMAGWFPNSQFVGYDLSTEAIAAAREQARSRSNVAFEQRDLTDFAEAAAAEPAGFDLITSFDAIHDQANPRSVLRGIRLSLAQGGVYLAQDIKASSSVHLNRDHPFGTMLYTISCLHCMTVSLAQGGEGLGAMWGREKAEAMMREAGFRTIEVHELEHDIQNYYYVCYP
jgi:2-polyprenyl-3-methyl-5-hydroxy-6-metoxy-1,4-benzoquinol methylase